MAKQAKGGAGNSEAGNNDLPDPSDFDAFRAWLRDKPREWSVVIAARAALRVLPLASGAGDRPDILLQVFRASAIARFSAKYPNRAMESRAAAASAARDTARAANVVDAAFPAASAADAAAYAASAAANANAAARTTASAAGAAAYSSADAGAIHYAARLDLQQLHAGIVTADQLARRSLWAKPRPASVGHAWRSLLQLFRVEDHWSVWIEWYEHVLVGTPSSVDEDAAFTDIPGELPWDAGAKAVNAEIARRLELIYSQLRTPEIPDQSAAPVRVEERDGKVAKVSDRDGPLDAAERDFRDWRDPVVDHIAELSSADFAVGTNHSRVRDRLLAFGKLLPGEIVDVKERQFHIGYEIERFDGLVWAYRTGGDDMPVLNAAQLEDLTRLLVALKMGIGKLERWSEFRKIASDSAGQEGDADRGILAEALEEMAVNMERQPRYFDPELPVSFRFLSEAVRDWQGATKTVVYGAVKSAENVISFLGQRALGIGKKTVDEVEARIPKALARMLLLGLSGAALTLSGALPQAWDWLKPLLEALSKLS
jgi:hypothetical protein